MTNNNDSNPWRSLDTLLSAYNEGDINDLDLAFATLTLIDIVDPAVIFDRLPEHLKAEFLNQARSILEADLRIYNLATREPLPEEAHERLAIWMKLKQ